MLVGAQNLAGKWLFLTRTGWLTPVPHLADTMDLQSRVSMAAQLNDMAVWYELGYSVDPTNSHVVTTVPLRPAFSCRPDGTLNRRLVEVAAMPSWDEGNFFVQIRNGESAQIPESYLDWH